MPIHILFTPILTRDKCYGGVRKCITGLLCIVFSSDVSSTSSNWSRHTLEVIVYYNNKLSCCCDSRSYCMQHFISQGKVAALISCGELSLYN